MTDVTDTPVNRANATVNMISNDLKHPEKDVKSAMENLLENAGIELENAPTLAMSVSSKFDGIIDSLQKGKSQGREF